MNLSMEEARARIEKGSYAARRTSEWYLEALRIDYGHEPFSASQAAESWDIPRKECLRTARRLVLAGLLKEGKAQMFSMVRHNAPEYEPTPDDERLRFRHWCVKHRTTVTDAFKKAGLPPARGIEWLSKRLDLDADDLAAIRTLYV